jgi:hypothetical protein
MNHCIDTHQQTLHGFAIGKVTDDNFFMRARI